MAKVTAAAEPEADAELEGGRMPFMQHLGELRDRVRNAAIAFVAAFMVCWGFADEIFAWLCKPMFDIWDQHSGPEIERLIQLKLLPATWNWGPSKMIYIGLTEPFWVNMSVALWAGIFLASPFIFYQLWRFIAPGLYKRERKVAASFTVLSVVFFVSGALFCYRYALPALNNFMLGYISPHLQAQLQIEKYLDLTRDMMLAFGAIFEMPLLIYFLAMIGVVTHRSLWKFSRWFVVLAFVIGAVLTPGPDVLSQFLMAIPMIALYNISILFAWRVTVKRERAQAEQLAREEALGTKKKRKVVVEDDDDDRNTV
jgi:sec-independent protein translocase protein TatC